VSPQTYVKLALFRSTEPVDDHWPLLYASVMFRATFIIMLTIASLQATAAAVPRDACSLITKADIQRVLRWPINSMSDEPYHIAASSGTVCTYEARDGAVIVTLPETGSAFLGTNPLVEPGPNGLMVSVNGVGDSAQIFDGTIYVKKRQRGFSVKIVPDSNTNPSNTDLIKLAKIAAVHIR
jgi:hypothetical protein